MRHTPNLCRTFVTWSILLTGSAFTPGFFPPIIAAQAQEQMAATIEATKNPRRFDALPNEEWDAYVKRVFGNSTDPRFPRLGETYDQYDKRVPNWGSTHDDFSPEEETSFQLLGIMRAERNRKDSIAYEEKRQVRLKEFAAILDKYRLATEDTQETDGAIAALSEYGVRRDPSGGKEKVLRAEQVLPLVAPLISNGNRYIRYRALEILGHWGVEAKNYLPAIYARSKVETDGNTLNAIYNALYGIDPNSTETRNYIMDQLRKGLVLGSGVGTNLFIANEKEALPLIEQSLASPLNGSPEGTFYTLGYVAQATRYKEMSLDEAIGVLNDFDEQYKDFPPKTAAAFFVLMKAPREQAPRIFPVVTGLLAENDNYLAVYGSVKVLLVTGLDEKGEALKWLVRRLRQSGQLGSGGSLLSATIRLLAQVQPGDGAQVPAIVEALSYVKDRGELNRALFITLRRIGPQAQAATPLLWKMLQDGLDTGYINLEGLYALATIGQESPAQVEEIVKWLATPPKGKEGQPRHINAPALLYLLSQWNLNPKQKADPRLQSILVDGLNSGRGPWIGAAARLSGQLGDNATPLIPILIERLNSSNEGVMTAEFQSTMMAIPAPRLEDRPFLDQMKHGFDDRPMTTTIIEVVQALGNLGPRASAAIPDLEVAAKSDDSFYRDDAREALQKIDARPASPWKPDIDLGKATLPFRFTDLQGNSIQFARLQGKIPVFVFMDTTCPCVTAYLPRLGQLKKNYEAKGMIAYAVFSSPEDTKESIQKFVTDQELSWTVILDKDQSLLKLFHATTTTQTFAFNSQGVLIYRGRVDDSTFNSKVVKDQTLQKVLTSIVEGRATPKETLVVGCRITRL